MINRSACRELLNFVTEPNEDTVAGLIRIPALYKIIDNGRVVKDGKTSSYSPLVLSLARYLALATATLLERLIKYQTPPVESINSSLDWKKVSNYF